MGKSIKPTPGDEVNGVVCLGFVEYDRNRNMVCRFRCECGGEFVALMSSIKSGNTKSCGCLRMKLITQHGLMRRGSPNLTYRCWKSMIYRCYDENSPAYERYGRRGILVCDRWLLSFEDFLADMGERPGNGYSIDRINVNGNYEPTNCRWATVSQQNRNKRNSRWITVDGETLLLCDWAIRLGITTGQLHNRIKGMGEQEAIKKPIRRRKKTEDQGVTDE